MICTACRGAHTFQMSFSNPNSEAALWAARDAHAQCKGCDCQHRVTAIPVEDTVKEGGSDDSNDGAAARATESR